MKSYLSFFLFLLLFHIKSFGQEKTLLKTWSSKDLAYLKIDLKHVYFEVYGQYQYQKGYDIIGDTLRLNDKYTSSRDNYSKLHTDYFDFLIKKLTPHKLILVPLNSNAKDISNGKKEFKYTDIKNVIDKKLKFNQIRYRIYGGAWEWVDVSFSIDDKRNFKYINKSKKNNLEYFTGRLSREQYDIFLTLLKSSEIDKLYGFKQTVFDVPESTLEIDYNGKSKHIKQDILPAITIDLVNFISGLPKKVSLSRADPFQINFRNQ